MPLLMEQLGLGDRAKKKALCPWHDDKNPSFGIYQNGNGKWKFACHAGCGQGDEVDLIKKTLAIQDDGEAIRQYANMAGIEPEKGMTAGQFLTEATEIFNATPSEAEPDAPQAPAVVHAAGALSQSVETQEPAKLEPLGAKAITQVATWRGYSPEFVRGLTNAGIIGKFGDNYIAFPVANGVHYRKPDGSWRYSEGAKPDLFKTGEIEEGAPVQVFESQWDALAYAEASGEMNNIAATRGAGNVKLLADKLSEHTGTLYLWPQNDAAGLKWMQDIHKMLPAVQMKQCAVPNEHKDLNDWRKASATDGDIFNAFVDAKDLSGADNAGSDQMVDEPTSQTGKPLPEPPAQNNMGAVGVTTHQPAFVSSAAAPANLPVPVLASPKPPRMQSHDETSGEARESTTRPLSRLGDSRAGQNTLSGGGLIAAEPLAVQVRPIAHAAALAATLDEAKTYLQRFVVFPDEEQAIVCALWAAHTYVYSAFDYSPILHIFSPEKGCGKSVLLEAIGLLCNKPSSFVNTSEAALFREINAEKPTLLWDEIDNFIIEEKSPFVGMLNAGYKRGGQVKRCADYGKSIDTFDVYCPKALTGIGRIPDTTHRRCLDIRLAREAKGMMEKFRGVRAEPLAKPIAASLLAWARGALASLTGIEVKLPDQLTGAQEDICEPLLAVADQAGGEWPEKAREAVIAICASAEDQSVGAQLLDSCRKAFSFSNTDKMQSSELLERLIREEDANAPWAAWWENDVKRGNVQGPAQKLARLLDSFSIKPRTFRGEDDKTHKGYFKADFDDAWRRYLAPVTGLVTMELGI